MKVKLISRATLPQHEFANSDQEFPAFVGGFGCVRDSTEILTPSGRVCIADLNAGDDTLSWSETDQRFQHAPTSGGFPKGKANLVRVITTHGEFVASEHHRVRVHAYSYQPLASLRVGSLVSACEPGLLLTSTVPDRIWSHEDDQRYWQKLLNYLGDCGSLGHQHDPRLLEAVENALTHAQEQADVHRFSQDFSLDKPLQKDGPLGQKHTHNRLNQYADHQKKNCFAHLLGEIAGVVANQTPAKCAEHIWRLIAQIRIFLSSFYGHQQGFLFDQLHRVLFDLFREVFQSHAFALAGQSLSPALARNSERFQAHQQSAERCGLHQKDHRFLIEDPDSVAALDASLSKATIICMERLPRQEWYWDMHVAGNNNYVTPDGVIHHNSGKTEAGIKRVLRLKWRYPQNDIAYYLPTYDLVKLIAYPRFINVLEAAKVHYTLNKSDHVMKIKGKGKIIFRTLDNPERIVGYEVGDSIVDELDTLKRNDAEHCWNQIIARNRQKKPDNGLNTVGVATTPEGFKFVYERWDKVKEEGYHLIRASTYSNQRNLPARYIESLKKTYPPQLIAAYLEGKFVNLTSGAVYPDFDRKLNHTSECIAEGEHLHIGLDFNVYNCTAVVGVIRLGVPRVLKELTKMRDTPAVIKTLKETFPGHKISVYPDASGQSNKTINASESDILLLQDAGFIVNVNSRNPFVKERVMSVNAMILNAVFERRLLVNTIACPVVTECLEQQIYDDNGEPDKTQGKDHSNDALGYWIDFLWAVAKPKAAVITSLSI